MRTVAAGLEEVASEWPPEVPRAMPGTPAPPASPPPPDPAPGHAQLRRCHNHV